MSELRYPAGARPPPAVITVVSSPACHLCEDAKAALTELAGRYPLLIEHVDITSDHGLALAAEHRPPMSPLVLLDGALFSFGRLPRRKLVKVLEQRSTALPALAAGVGGAEA